MAEVIRNQPEVEFPSSAMTIQLCLTDQDDIRSVPSERLDPPESAIVASRIRSYRSFPDLNPSCQQDMEEPTTLLRDLVTQKRSHRSAVFVWHLLNPKLLSIGFEFRSLKPGRVVLKSRSSVDSPLRRFKPLPGSC